MMKNLKKFFTSKVTLAVLACLLLVGVFAGITVLATENTPALELTGVGINHDATPAIKYDVTITGLSGEITDNLDRYEMRFWGYEPADVNDAGYTDVASVANNRAFFGEYADGAQSVSFLSKGFAPKEMTDTIFAAAVYVDEDGNVAAATAVKRYSVFEYICEVNFSGNAEQKALVAALKDYISYAQQYLGYTDSASVSEVGYMKVTNGKFWVVERNSATGAYERVSEQAYTAGTFLVGTNFWVEADYETAVFYRVDGGWYNYPQTSATGLKNVYITTVSEGDATRHYQALPATEVTFNYGEGYELLSMTGNIIDKEYSYNRTNAQSVANGAAVITSDAIENVRYALVANLYDENGVMFSHWEDAEGNVLGTINPVLNVTDMINNDVYAQALDLSGITAVYEATTADRYTEFDNITGGGSVDLPSVGENGELIYDSTSRPTSNPGGQTANITGVTTGDKLANVSKVVWTYDFEITANNDNADSNWTMDDFFTGTSNPCAYQIRPSLGNNHEGALCYFQFYASRDDKNNVTGWYVNLANGSNNNKSMSFTNAKNIMSVEGKHNITLIVDVETLANGRLEQKGVSIYTDGVYAGTVQRTYNDYASINYTGETIVFWATLMRSKLMVTITDMSMKEFI